MSSTHDKYAIGIDLGTTYCSVAVFKDGSVKVVEDAQGNRRIPSYVAFTDDEYLVGFLAKSQAAVNPSNTVHGVKRLLGRRFDDPELESDIKYWPFSVIDENGRTKIKVQYKTETKVFCPEEITALILTAMKEMAEAYTGKDSVSDVVISVPGNFNNVQRKATMDAAHIAGLNVLQLINDTTAAAIAYCTEKKITDKHNMLVFDLGGGSFDVSMVAIQNGKMEVKAISGETHLGGEDFVNNMLRHIVKDFQQNGNIDATSNKFLPTLKDACELAKMELSKLPVTRIQVEGSDYSNKMNAEKFNEYNKTLYTKMMKHAMKVQNLSMIDNDNFMILLVGGCTRIPNIEELLKTEFSGVRISKGINRDEAVAYGAAVLAALLHLDKSDAIAHFVEIVDKPDQNITGDSYGITEQDIERMKSTAQDLKNDCIMYTKQMQCRNYLEGYIIKVQAELRDMDNNVAVLEKCNQILDWMSENQKATIDEYEIIEKDLMALREILVIAAPSSSSLHVNVPATPTEPA